MNHITLNEEQVKVGMPEAGCRTEVSAAIAEADKKATDINVLTVVRTKSNGVCIFGEFQLRVAKDEIVEVVYNTKAGFIYSKVA